MEILTEFNQSKKIIKIIGTPFNEPENIKLEKIEMKELFKNSLKNKLGLLFLESLEKNGRLPNILEKEFDEQKKLKKLQKDTLERMVKSINKINCKYAIIKTIFPFSAIPNDVDVLLFDNDLIYRKIIDQLEKDNFIILGEAPMEINLRDMNTAQSSDPKVKQWEDIDIYREVGASHLTYMNKNLLEKYIIEEIVDDKKYFKLTKPAELAISIFHAIYPERIYTLLLHYNILHQVNFMSKTELGLFIKICKEQRMIKAACMTLNVTEKIQEMCFNISPTKISELREKLGMKTQVSITKIPYVFPFKNVLSAFWEKKTETKFVKSMIKQIISMCNLKTADFVIKQYKERGNRDTY